MTAALLTSEPSPTGPPCPDPASPSTTRVVLIDPRSERRAITRELVERCPALTVVGLAADLGEASAQIRAELADVALVEINMPVAQGLTTIGALRAEFADLCIVVSSFQSDTATREAARLRGVDAYLTKPLRIEELVPVVASARPRSDATQAEHSNAHPVAMPSPSGS